MSEKRIHQIVLFNDGALVGDKIYNIDKVIEELNNIVENNSIDDAYYDKQRNIYIIPYMEESVDNLYITIKNRCTIYKECHNKMLNSIIATSKKNHKIKQKELVYKKSRG